MQFANSAVSLEQIKHCNFNGWLVNSKLKQYFSRNLNNKVLGLITAVKIIILLLLLSRPLNFQLNFVIRKKC